MILTFTDDTTLTCLDQSNNNELFFDYDKTTFTSLLDTFTYEKLNGALLELYDSDDNVIYTDAITFKKLSNVEISNNIVKLSLRRLTTLEQDIHELTTQLNNILEVLENMMLESELLE